MDATLVEVGLGGVRSFFAGGVPTGKLISGGCSGWAQQIFNRNKFCSGLMIMITNDYHWLSWLKGAGHLHQDTESCGHSGMNAKKTNLYNLVKPNRETYDIVTFNFLAMSCVLLCFLEVSRVSMSSVGAISLCMLWFGYLGSSSHISRNQTPIFTMADTQLLLFSR